MATETVTQEQLEQALLDQINAGVKPVHLTAAKSESGQAFTEAEWDRTSLPFPVKHRMIEIEVAIRGLDAVTQLLSIDATNRNDESDNGNVTFSPLEAQTLEGLRYAQSALLARAGDALHRIREGCQTETQA